MYPENAVFQRSFGFHILWWVTPDRRVCFHPPRMTEPEQLLRRAAPLSGDTNIFLERNPGESNEDGSIARRLARWRNNAAENSSEAFDQRLEWDGLTSETAQSVLADERPLNPGDDLWAVMARMVVQRLGDEGGDGRCPAPPGVPFAPILSPLVSLAISELSLATGVPPLAPSIEAQLGEPLYQRLSDIAHRAAGGEFRSFRDALPAREGAWRAFEQHMLQGGWLALFERLPVLLRLLATAISLWVTETADFLRRLDADREDLGQVFGSGGHPGDAVEQISGMLSDPHCGGRNVKIVRFASGLRVVYKPKSLAIDAAWFELTEWIVGRTGLALRSPRVLNRGDWGWVEFIPHEPCRDTEAVERFYRRAGQLLCLLYATASGDFHHENMMASGEFPVPIDLETVFNPEPITLEEPTASTLRFQRSVLGTLMLPGWMELSGQTDAVDLSALGSRPDTQPRTTKRRWIHPNSDAMEFVAIREKGKQPQSTPFHADEPGPDA